MQAAVGLRTHSGWAAGVLAAGSVQKPVVLDRRRLVLADEEALEGSKQPYHAMEGRLPAAARDMRARFVADAGARAADELRSMVEAARAAGSPVEAVGLLVAAGRALPDLPSILASHALIHTADGVHFRGALLAAGEGLGLRVVAIRERDLEEKMTSEIAALGKGLGPPWTTDQKLATLAALLALGG